ncbi:MAG TPA: hypothetical protein VMJ65_03660 [Solirubrobacteraceae bacterium]|nr:hypothetical protein [Solirubrobacteraceae bacterium]
MFQSSAKRLRAWFALVDDLLGDAPDDAHLDLEPWAMHPHRRPLRAQRRRRAGSVPAPPAHCISPVRPMPTLGGRSEVMR